jgi:hypothetical protein
VNVVPKTGRQLVASDFVVGFDGGFYGYACMHHVHCANSIYPDSW